jgi:uncharacterized membrane protein YhfC
MTTTIAAFLNPLLMMTMPLLLGIFLANRLKVEWRLYGLGMLAFVGSQVLHIPFNAWVLSPLIQGWHLEPAPGSAQLAIMALLLGLSAGVFEEGARWLVYGRWLRENRSWRDGLMFGAGHGGMEAILLGLLSFYSFLQLTALRGADLGQVLRADQIESVRSVLQMYWSLPYYQHLIPALERAAAICMHLGLSVLVLQAFAQNNRLWFALAVVWHALVDAVAVFAVSTWGVYVAEGLVVMGGLLSVGMVLALRRPEEGISHPESELPASEPALLRIESGAEKLDRDRLDKSRYFDGS